MHCRVTGSTALFASSFLWVLCGAFGCDQNQHAMQWGGGNMNWFGGGTFTKNYSLQYPVGDMQVLNPAAVQPAPFEFKNPFKQHTHTRSYDLQYPVGKPQPVAARQTRRSAQPAPQPRHVATASTPRYAAAPVNSDAGSHSYTRKFDLQYAIGATQGVNGHRVAASSPTNNYSRHYNLQYAIGSTQPIRRGHQGASNHAMASRSHHAQPRARHGGARMTSTSGGGTYTVRPGDTMMSIARRHYGNSNAGRWQDIMSANRHQLQRPDEIVPGMQLRIP